MIDSRILTSLLVFAASGGSAFADSFQVRGSLRQFFVIGASPGANVELFDPTGLRVQKGMTDELGGLVFRNVEPGKGYVAAVTVKGEKFFSEPTPVLSEKNVPPESFYQSQVLPVGIYGSAGYGYLTTRDGTQLSVQVQLPIFPEDRAGQAYPTVIEYSGYDPSNPAADDLVRGRVNEFRLIAALLGYAYVGVNIRGTGCSGGAFEYFEPLQSFDGYDVVEVVAAQPWVQYGRPGMVGISYSGISQLFVAQTRPPHLAAITPLSVIDDTFRGTLYPGGIFNDGFARSWAIERQQQNRWPDPVGADWVVNQVNEGDATCAYDQLLRQQNPDLLAKIERNPFYPAVGNPEYPNGGDVLAPFAFVRQINVPTFMVGAWQDDQTGGHWSVMVDQFDPATELRVVANNGTHADSLGPVNLLRLLEFLDFRVARRLPIVPLEVRGLAPLLYSLVFAADGVQLPPDRFAGYTLEEALALYDGEDRIHISWESGAKPGAQTLGSPEPAAESDYARWPPAETVAQRLYLQPEGGLTADPPSIADDDPRAVDAYEYDLSVKPRTDFRCSGGGDPNTCRSELWRAGVVYDWRPLPVGYTQSFISEPLPNQLTLLGSASADLWIASTDPDTDIEITLTEVRSDGQERYVQNGWLRASHRRLDEKHSTELRPRQTHLEVDAELLPKNDFAFVRVEIFPFAHVFRPGSQIRLSVEAPGGNRPLWTFDALTGKDTTNWLAHSVHRPSSLVLPVVPDVKVPAELPPCPTSLRAQPCRFYR
jgi:predicted acyl esterase